MRPSLIILPSTQAQWHALLQEAQDVVGQPLDDDLSHYLLLTLEHYNNGSGIIGSVMALDFMTALQTNGQQGLVLLRDIGDRSLITVGLFPGRAQQHSVSLGYYIGMGQQAYSAIASSGVPLPDAWSRSFFSHISCHFIGLMDVLNTMRLLSRR